MAPTRIADAPEGERRIPHNRYPDKEPLRETDRQAETFGNQIFTWLQSFLILRGSSARESVRLSRGPVLKNDRMEWRS